MFDSIDVGQLPADGENFAAYVDGHWPNWSEVVQRFPGANVLSIAVNPAGDAECLDIETGDATPEDAAAWYVRQLGRGVARPCLYADASTMADVITAIQAARILRPAVRLWSAHYTGSAHICGPSSCRTLSIDADGTQWTDSAWSRDLDESLLLPDFFDSPPPPVPADGWETAMLATLPALALGSDDANLPHWYVHRVQAICNDVYGRVPRLVVDGTYGDLTRNAVTAIQQQAGIAADGVTGPATWSVLVTGSPS